MPRNDGRTFLHRLALLLAVALPLGAAITIPAAASAASCNTKATSSWSNNCTDAQGNASNMVIAIQTVLAMYHAAHSVCSPGTIDGVFGANTNSAVRCFQSHTGLSVDGIVGPNTWSKLQSQLNTHFCDGSWCYYSDNTGGAISYGTAFRQWAPSGVWYVVKEAGVNETFVQMDGP